MGGVEKKKPKKNAPARLGEERFETLVAASNYASGLVIQERFKEAKALMRRTVPVARRNLGEEHRITLKIRWNYARSLYKPAERGRRNAGATLDDLREAVETLAETEPIARRVLGSAHPDTEGIEDNLRHARAALAARETPPPSEPAAVTSVPDPELDEGAVNPWLADQISKLAASREHVA